MKIRFTSLKPPKIDTTFTVAPSQTFHAVKVHLADETKLNPLALRFLFKNKAINDSKSVQEVFGQAEEVQVTVMVMKNASSPQSTQSKSSQIEPEKIDVGNEEFWNGIRAVVLEKFNGTHDKEEVFAALKYGFQEHFGTS